MMGRIAVTGADGQLGTAWQGLLGNRGHYLTLEDCDLSVPGAITQVFETIRPSAIINCAAYTAVDRAEEEPQLVRAINALAVREMAEAAAGLEIPFVTYSTDYVFDGTSPDPYTESSPTSPINVYGATKQEGERLALAAHPPTLIVRTSWVLSGTHPSFAATMLRLISEGPVRVVDDQRGHPTLVEDLAVGTLRALEVGAAGIVHLTNQGVITWYELAREVAVLAGLPADRVSPTSTGEYPTIARRPANSVLESERLSELGIDPLPHFRPSLERAVRSLLER